MLSPYKDAELPLDYPPTRDEIVRFTKKYKDILDRPGHFVGVYQNDAGKYVMDVVLLCLRRMLHLDEINAMGRQWGQVELVDQDLAEAGASVKDFMIKTGVDQKTLDLPVDEWRGVGDYIGSRHFN